MLPISYLREHTQEALQRLAIKNFSDTDLVNRLLEADRHRRKLQAELDTLLAQQNALARQVGELMRSGRHQEADDLKNKTAALKETINQIREELTRAEQQTHSLLLQIPNAPSFNVPRGQTAADNAEVYRNAVPFPSFDKKPKTHWELAQEYGLIDFELGSKITGSGFPVYTGKGARLQRALINFFLDRAAAAGYQEVQPPCLVNESSGFGTGQLPDKEGQMYHIPIDNLYLIPTAEVPVTNFFRDVILHHSELPVKLTAYTPCFRREAGSYGKEVRGLNRLHQFDKVEIVQIQHPDRSYQTLEEMKEYVASLVDSLELPYRIVILCGGDMSFASAMTYDFEVWSAAQQRWLEVSSVSNFEAFQSNRMKLRFRDEKNKIHLAHTLNGSALALPRIVAALLENNQSEKGIRIPDVLIPYTGFERISKD
jgi:seryl-tRNA synthetase